MGNGREKKSIMHLISFSIFLVERSNVERIGCVHFTARRNERRWVFLHVNLLPVDAQKERMFFYFISPVLTKKKKKKKH